MPLLTLLGQAAVGTDVSVNAGSLVITTFPATVSLDRDVAVNAGSLVLTPNTATVSLDRDISANAGSLVITPQPATISKATTISVNAGSLVLTPFAATIQAGDAVEEPVDIGSGRGGGGNVGILYKGFKLPDVVEAFQIDDTPNPTPTFASEIERRNAAIRSLAEQIKTVEQETRQLRQTEDLNNQIRAEELALDTFHVEQFIERLAIDMQELRQEKRRREEEELITILLNSWNVKIH